MNRDLFCGVDTSRDDVYRIDMPPTMFFTLRKLYTDPGGISKLKSDDIDNMEMFMNFLNNTKKTLPSPGQEPETELSKLLNPGIGINFDEIDKKMVEFLRAWLNQKIDLLTNGMSVRAEVLLSHPGETQYQNEVDVFLFDGEIRLQAYRAVMEQVDCILKGLS